MGNLIGQIVAYAVGTLLVLALLACVVEALCRQIAKDNAHRLAKRCRQPRGRRHS